MMRNWFILRASTIAIAAGAVGAVVSLSVTRPAGQATRPARTVDNHPNFSGIWQANNNLSDELRAPGLNPVDGVLKSAGSSTTQRRARRSTRRT